MKKNRIIAMLLGTALLVCGCQQTSKATDEEKDGVRKEYN